MENKKKVLVIGVIGADVHAVGNKILYHAFTEAGFDRELSVKMINSALLLRRGEETYATLDICEIDLFNGHAVFIKLGAAASYLWRNGRIISLRSAALPAGILKQVVPEQNEMLLKDGDMLLIVTIQIVLYITKNMLL